MALGLLALGLALGMYISCCLCQFHLRRAPNANPFFCGIWALGEKSPVIQEVETRVFVLRWVIPFPDASSLALDSSPAATSFGTISIEMDRGNDLNRESHQYVSGKKKNSDIGYKG